MATGLLDMVQGLCGCSCKVSQEELENLLNISGIVEPHQHPDVLASIGEDAGIIRIDKRRVLVQSVDVLTPVTDDPYMQGRIAVNNACNDLFAKGVTEINGVLTIVCLPKSALSLGEDILRGMSDYVREVGSVIIGGHTIYNPWSLTGAAVVGVADKDRIAYNSTAKPGDVVILTKPLGIQPIITAYQELRSQEGVDDLKDLINETMKRAINVMSASSRPVAQAMQEVGVHASTDVTGFGLSGHAGEMARRSRVDLIFHTIPVIAGARKMAELFMYPLTEGKTAETAGGILLSVDAGKADAMLKNLKARGVKGFEIGSVVKGSGTVSMSKEARVIEVR
jgi:selenide,water dikinase